MHSVPRGVEEAGRVLPREALAQLAKNQPKALGEHCLPSAGGGFSTLGVSQCGQATRRMAQANGVCRPNTGTNWKWRVSKRSQPDSRQAEEKQVDFQVAVAALVAVQAAVAVDEASQLVDATQCGVQFQGERLRARRAGEPSDPGRSGRMPPIAPRGARDLGTCATEVSGLWPQPFQALEGSAPQNPRGIPRAWSPDVAAGVAK